MSRQAVYEASLGFFLQPIAAFLDDPEVTEVMVNGHQQIFVERAGKIHETDAVFASEDSLRSAINNLAQSVGRTISENKPVLDARLPDGSRVHAIIPPSARSGTYLTIRKFTRTPLTVDDLIRFGSLTNAANEFLEICVALRKNIIIAGGSGTGKTSMLGALSQAIPESERIIVIEDTSELRLHQKHCLYLETQPAARPNQTEMTVRELFRSSLRMRPDRIVVGEVRGGEALDLIQSMISGHEGSLSTVHASSAFDALVRLETLSLMSEIQLPVHVARSQVASAIDVVVQLSRSSETGQRFVSKITEVHRLDQDNQYQLQELFARVPIVDGANDSSYEEPLDQNQGNQTIGLAVQSNMPGGDLGLLPTGLRPSFADDIHLHGLQNKVFFSEALWKNLADQPVVRPKGQAGETGQNQ